MKAGRVSPAGQASAGYTPSPHTIRGMLELLHFTTLEGEVCFTDNLTWK